MRAGPGGDAGPGGEAEAIDPDVDLHVPAQRAELGGSRKWAVLGAVSAGGAIGASARHGAALLWPASEGAFPWAVFGVNVVGCALIGVLMALVGEGGRSAPSLVRPFLGAGVLGGFTTFSTYALDFSGLVERQEAGTALAYLGGTVIGAMGAVWMSASATRAALARAAAR